MEAILVIPTLIAFFGTTLYIYRSYSRHVGLAAVARAETWTHAYGACRGGGGGNNTRTDSISPGRRGSPMRAAMSWLETTPPALARLFAWPDVPQTAFSTIQRGEVSAPDYLQKNSVRRVAFGLSIPCNIELEPTPTVDDAVRTTWTAPGELNPFDGGVIRPPPLRFP